jgi:hypothetical protein
MLTTNRAVHDCGAGLNCNATGCSRSNRAIDYRKERLVLINILHYVSNELSALKWETNMHHIAPRDGCQLIDIDAKYLISVL